MAHIVVGDRTFSREEVTAAYLRRVAQARGAGLAVEEPTEGDLRHAPLSVLVGASQELKRRLEDRAGAQPSAAEPAGK